MATILNSNFSLNTITGTDPININIAPAFSIKDPSGSGSFTTKKASTEYILSPAETSDAYILIRNTGASTAGNILVTTSAAVNIGLLKPQDFLFIPLKTGVGLNVVWDTEITTVEWFYWTRS